MSNTFEKAILNKEIQRAILLLSEQNFNTPIKGDTRAIHLCAAYGGEWNTLLIAILNLKACNPNVTNEHQYTALHFAAKTNNIQGIKVLLDKGANPRLLSDNNERPVDFASDKECVRILNEAHANYKEKIKRSSVDAHKSTPPAHTNYANVLEEKSSHSSHEWIINPTELQINQEIGRGTQGRVLLGEWLSLPVAIKEVDGNNEELVKELEKLKILRPHPNLVMMLGLIVEPNKTFIVMKYYSKGSLDKILIQEYLNISIKVKIAIGVARGLLFLHKAHKLIHRDIAARNILLEEDFEPVIADYGYARILKIGEDLATTRQTVGPVKWMAPECILRQEYSEKSDVWSYGVLLIEIITNSRPFPDTEKPQHAQWICNPQNTVPLPRAPKFFLEIMKKCFQYYPEDRIPIKEVVDTLATTMKSGNYN